MSLRILLHVPIKEKKQTNNLNLTTRICELGAPSVTLARLLVLRSSHDFFKEKRDSSQVITVQRQISTHLPLIIPQQLFETIKFKMATQKVHSHATSNILFGQTPIRKSLQQDLPSKKMFVFFFWRSSEVKGVTYQLRICFVIFPSHYSLFVLLSSPVSVAALTFLQICRCVRFVN